LRRWGAHSHDAHSCSPAKVQHNTLATEARRALGTWHGGAPQSGPRPDERKTHPEGAFRRTADAACLGWQRSGGVTRATRVVARSWGNGDTPTLGDSKARTQASLWEGNSAREGEATVLTAGRRCSRCRLVEEGGATWTYAAAPGSLLCFGVSSRRERSPSFRCDPSGSSRPRSAPGSSALAATRLKAPPASPPLLPLPPSLLSAALRGYHLAMPTRSIDQILLKLQLWQSSDKVKSTQVGN
jgi:hypothetical protein